MEKVREAGYVAHPVSCPSSCPALVVCEILALGEDSSPKAEQKGPSEGSFSRSPQTDGEKSSPVHMKIVRALLRK